MHTKYLYTEINKILLTGLEKIELNMIELEMIGLEMIGLDMIGLEVTGLEMIWLDMIGLDMIGLEMIVNQIFSLLMKISVQNKIISMHTTVHSCTLWESLV